MLAIAARHEVRAPVSTVHTSEARPLLCTRKSQRGCVSQTISAAGKDSRSAATAGKVWIMSPSDPSRTTRKRGSDMRSLAHGIEKFARGMILRVADNGYTDTEARRDCTLRDGLGGVARSFTL